MSLLYERKDANAGRHIINVFEEGELPRENNVHFLHVNERLFIKSNTDLQSHSE